MSKCNDTKCEKRTSNTLDFDENNDMRNDIIFAEDHRKKPRSVNCCTYMGRDRKKARVQSNSDLSGLSIDFDRQMDDPRANEGMRRRLVNQEFEYDNKIVGDSVCCGTRRKIQH